MTRWLEAARQAPMAPDKTDLTDLTDKTPSQGFSVVTTRANLEVKSVLSVLSPGGMAGNTPSLTTNCLPTDPVAYIAFLQSNGPATYGAMAVALGWGATRAWQAEARLRAAGLVRYDTEGKAHSRHITGDE